MRDNLARSSGILYIVATPIGNVEDISSRAISTLKIVDRILAEDTRHSINLLNHLGIKKSLTSFHAHNEGEKTQGIIDSLLSGESLALISDAGTPLISDPGYPLVKSARDQGISVVPIPGACAVTTALSAAGVPCDIYTFAGFLPAKSSARITKLKEMKMAPHTLVFYESTHRIIDSLKDIAQVFGDDGQIVLAKELTKTFETFVTGTCSNINAWLMEDNARSKGEFVLIIPPRIIESDFTSIQKTLSTLLEELPLKQAVKIAAKLTSLNKNELYQMALEIKT